MAVGGSETIVRVAVVQAGAIPFDTQRCIDKAATLTSDAAAAGARVIVFPEAFVTGYPEGLNYGNVRSHEQAIGAVAVVRSVLTMSLPASTQVNSFGLCSPSRHSYLHARISPTSGFSLTRSIC